MRYNLVLILLVLLTCNSCGKSPPNPPVYHIGLLQMTDELNLVIKGFKDELTNLGYKENENVIYDYRHGQGLRAKALKHAQNFVDEKVDLIFVCTTPGTQAAKAATVDTDIPVVFAPVSDPIGAGIVRSIKSSGNNLTGICSMVVTGKQLEILKELKPGIKRVMMVFNPEDDSALPAAAQVRQAAPKLGLKLIERHVTTPEEVRKAANSIKKGQTQAIFTLPDALVASQMEPLIKVANVLKLPLLAPTEGGVRLGALVSYAADNYEIGRDAARLADKILRGTQPSHLPIQFPMKIDLAINLNTAKTIGLKIPDTVLAKADKVIQ